MKQLLRLSGLLAVLAIAPLAQAKSPALYTADVPLRWGASGEALGVEPEGGRFMSILQKGEAGPKTLSVPLAAASRNQLFSTLAIYAGESPAMFDEKPIARLDISGPGRGHSAVAVTFTRTGRTLTVDVQPLTDGSGASRPLAARAKAAQPDALPPIAAGPSGTAARAAQSATKMRLVPEQEIKATVYGSDASTKGKVKPGQGPNGPLPGEKPGLPGIGSVKPGAMQLPPVHAPSPAPGAPGFIGVRTPGGVVQQLFAKGTTDRTEKSWFIRPMYTDQDTADVSLLVGTGPYIENNKLWQRYVITDIPPGPNRRIRVTVKGGMNPNAEKPTADLFTGASKTPVKSLNVVKYSDWKPAKDHAEPQDLRPVKRGTLPVAPGVRT